MNALELALKEINPYLLGHLEETKQAVDLLLQKYSANFPTYTDHSLKHTEQVFKLASELLTPAEIRNLNADEIYILAMASLLHDIGMCIPIDKIETIANTEDLIQYRKSNPNLTNEEYIRNIHHNLSKHFIIQEWELLKIINLNYANAIAVVAEGHRKVLLDNIDIYEPKHFIKAGRDFVCLPYLACVLRIADELDVTNIRTPDLLTKYYMPNNEKSLQEWRKHIATTQINFTEDYAIFKVACSDHNAYSALQEQFDKIKTVISYCQKVIRTISNTEDRKFTLKFIRIEVKYNFVNFDPKGIRFSLHVQNVINTFVGEDLYEDKLTGIREVIQNAIDSCNYKSILESNHKPEIKIIIHSDKIIFSDNGLGMDEFIIENFFGRLGSSYYQDIKIKKNFEAIGQFGVGVFSYFLLCDYIDIETKTNNNKALKFRIDKDERSYFHFFDRCERLSSGTTIHFYLKSNVIELINEGLILGYIKHFFRHISIPIHIIDGKEEFILHEQSLRLDDKEEISKRLKLYSKKYGNSYKLIKTYINNDEFEGELGLVVPEGFYHELFEKNFNMHFDFEAFNSDGEFSEIAISQKGVFVDYLHGSLFSKIVGKINLKHKHKININRNSFSDDSTIFEIINKFELSLIKALHSYFVEENKISELDFTSLFFNSYLNRFSTINNRLPVIEFGDIIKKIMFFEVHLNNKGLTEILSIEDLTNKYNEIMLVVVPEVKSKSIKESIYPYIIAGDRYSSYNEDLKSLFEIFSNYNLKIVIEKNEFRQILTLENLARNRDVEKKFSSDFLHMEAPYVILDPWRSKSKSFDSSENYYGLFNLNHPFIIHLLGIVNNVKLKESDLNICKTALSLIYDIDQFSIHSDDRLQALSEIMQKLNYNEMLKKKDFLEEVPVVIDGNKN